MQFAPEQWPSSERQLPSLNYDCKIKRDAVFAVGDVDGVNGIIESQSPVFAS